MTSSISIKLISDEPLLVQTHLAKDPYVTSTVFVQAPILVQQTFSKTLSALEARENGYTVNKFIPDHQEVTVHWEEEVEKLVPTHQTFLHLRKKSQDSSTKEVVTRTGRRITIRAELADAAENPLFFVKHSQLREAIQDEIKYWRKHDVGNDPLNPVVLVFLDVMDDEGGWCTKVRQIFYIREFHLSQMKVEDYQGKSHVITLSDDVLKASLTRRFIMFLPANALAYSEKGERMF